jgi:hypothetical protein
MFELIVELIAAIKIIIDIDSLKYVIFDARLNISRSELINFLKIKYEIYKKIIVFCSNMNIVNSFLNVNKSKNTENIYV